MTTFQDSQTRTWQLALTLGAVRQVKQKHRIDLGSVSDGEAFTQLAADAYLLGDVLATITAGQRETANVSDDDFADSLTGDVLDAARLALLEAVVGFAPPASRDPLRDVIAKTAAAQAEAVAAATTWLRDNSTRLAKDAAAEVRAALEAATE